MSTSSNFDLYSGSPDRPLCASRHRGSCRPSSLDRSLLSSLPNMSRSSSSVTQEDVCNFFRCLRFDPKSTVVEHKLNRPPEFKQLASAAIALPLEDSLPASSKSKQVSSPSLEDLTRLKSGVRESGTKARERVKIFNDCLSVINKCFPTVPSRKRSRLDALSNDQSNTLLSIHRSASLISGGRMGSQNYVCVRALELEQHESEERSKNAIPRKRTRTSMVDARANTPARPPGTMDKDSDVIKVSNSSAVQGVDRTLCVSVDGLENSKMKKKRTGIKPEAAASSVATKPVDGYRESKQAMQPQVSIKAHSRLIDANGFRSGIADGGPGVGKAGVTSQNTSGIRLSIYRTDSNKSSLLHEGKERPSCQEKERVNLKAANKANPQEDFSLGSLTSGSKLNANALAPRSASVGSISKLYQVVQGSTSSNDLALSSCTSKLLGTLGANNWKLGPSTQSTSPSVANWVQRPQKISRTARRTHLLPIFTGNDDCPAGDATPELMVNERRFSAKSPQKVKIKGNNLSQAALSESEESGATESMSRDKNKKGDEIYEGSGQDVQKLSTPLLPPRKSKAVSRDGYGDGVRRQGRTGRGFTSCRSLLHLTAEKTGNVRMTKQIRSSILDKTERACRPPTRKLSDKKAYTWQKHIAINMAADFLAGSDVGRKELLAAADAVIKTAQALSGPFWKKMEPLFRFISNTDISCLRDQVNPDLAVDTSTAALLDTDREVPNGFWFNESGREEIDTRTVQLTPEHSAPTPNEISLYQRLVAALIPEENEELFYGGKEVLKSDVYGSGFDVENDMESEAFSSHMSQGPGLSGCPTSSGYSVNSNRISFYGLDHSMRDDNIVPIQDTGYDCLQNDLLADPFMPGTECSKYQYHNMSMNERLLMEVHSIGIYPDLVSGDEEKSGDNCRSNEVYLGQKYQEKVSRKKGLVGKLLSSASEAQELQDKEFEGLALDKLVLMAYENYMSCCHGIKTASGKMAKQAALAFLRRTLERCWEFEATGKSCFGEPLYREMFLSGVSRLMDETPLTCIRNNESDKIYLGASGCSLELRTSAPVGTQQSPSSNNQEIYSSQVVLSANLGSEPHTSKEDSWPYGVKSRELLLADVGGIISMSLGGSLSCSAKGKRSERDRERKRNSREVLSRSGNSKIGRPSSATAKGDRKSKAKPKQKTADVSASVNGPLGKMSDRPKVMLSSTPSRSEIGKDKNDYNLDALEEPIDLSGLQLPEMDDLGVSIDLDGQGDDLGSWFNSIDDGGLQDHDYMGGLGIPKDNLADLNMMV